jgi:hypothetical protein
MQGHELCSVLTEATVSISANRSRKVAQQMRSAWRSWAFPTRRLATMDAVKSTAAIWSGQSPYRKSAQGSKLPCRTGTNAKLGAVLRSRGGNVDGIRHHQGPRPL